MKKISGFRIEKIIYENSNSVLYLGSRTTESYKTPIKLIKTQNPSIEELERFKMEFDLLHSLSIPGVIKAESFQKIENSYMIVFAPVEGVPIRELINSQSLTLQESLALSIQISILTGRLHEASIIHKNIQPAVFLWNNINRQLTLIDLNVAIKITAEKALQKNFGIIEGALPYISPEQTGRMNRLVDYRTDFYSMGVMFYELFTGSLPFDTSDPLELVYSHIAKLPPSPHQIRPHIPPLLSEIIMKLMEKDAEQRYQSAAGIQADLEECLDQLNRNGHIEKFQLGKNDISSLFRIPHKLYGRESEVAFLIKSFHRVSSGTAELLTIAGYSGVGKTTLVHELQRPVTAKSGYFIKGKFDQMQRNIPYAGWIQAFNDLVQNLLMENENHLTLWREKILKSVGKYGKFLTDLIPNLELIIGEQQPPPELNPAGVEFHFNNILEEFIRTFSGPEHPLVIFLDDLQWIDSASIKLLQKVASYHNMKFLLIIISYRDNEVSPSHPLIAALDNISKSGTSYHSITLSPLNADHTADLVSYTLSSDLKKIEPLSRLIFEKTRGNPFFVNQFLNTLHDEKLISFNNKKHSWEWDLSGIKRKGYTDNVVEMITEKLMKLSPPARKALTYAAYLDNHFDPVILSSISAISAVAITTSLQEALNEGLIMQLIDASYAFIHDRIHQAAYLMIQETQRAKMHLEIGKLLLSQLESTAPDEKIFDIVAHLNHGAALVTDQQEKYKHAGLNLMAGKKAKASTAYVSAAVFFVAGISLLASDSWESYYELTYELHANLAESTFLRGEPEEAKQMCDRILGFARSKQDLVRIYLLKIEILITLGDNQSALATGIESLHMLGIDIPLSPTDEQVLAEDELLKKLMGDREIEDLLNLPDCSDPDMAAAMGILMIMHPPSHFIADHNLYRLIPNRSVILSLMYGNAPASSFAYSDCALLLITKGNADDANRFGKMACVLAERFNTAIYRSKVFFMMGGVVSQFYEPLPVAEDYLRRCFDAAIEAGDITFAAFARIVTLEHSYLKGNTLTEVYAEFEKCVDFARKVRFGMIETLAVIYQRMVEVLRGNTIHLGSFNDASFDQTAFEEKIKDNFHDFCWYKTIKIQSSFFAGDYEAAFESYEKIKDKTVALLGEPISIEFYYFSSLTLAACYAEASTDRKQRLMQVLNEYIDQMEIWAVNCPTTFQNRFALVSAERARVEGRDNDAIPLYEAAIRSARENGFIQNEALAYELASKFWLAKGFDDFAQTYMIKSHQRYTRWQALGKTREIEMRYPQWFQAKSDDSKTESTMIDLMTITKASQTISGEIELHRLIERLMRILLENAGAERCLLILKKNSNWEVLSETTSSINFTGPQSSPLAERKDIPHSIINFVQRSRESILLNDASTEGAFTSDPYIIQNKPKSILTLPVILQKELTGILYLENNLVTHAFRPHHLEVMEILCSQVAISLENAFLFEKKNETEAELKESEKKYHTLFDRVPVGIFRSAPDGRLVDINPSYIQMLGFSTRDEVMAINAFDLYPNPEQRIQWQSEVEKKGILRDFEMLMRRKDGEIISVCMSCLAIRNSNGTVQYYEGIMEDITERKKAEKDRAKLEEQLRQSQKMETVGLLAGGIAHDFNNLLTPILGYTDMLIADSIPGSPKHHELTQVKLAADSAKDLTQRLLAFSRKQIIELKTVDLGNIITHVEKMLRRTIRENISININISPALSLIKADAGQIEQVLINLSFNAQDAMPEGGTMTIEAANIILDESYSNKHPEIAPGNYAMLAVSDTGIGMDDETIAHVFDPFFTTKDIGKGTGLGLSTVYGVVKQHKGSICVYSEKNHGSVFKVFLPLSVEAREMNEKIDPAADILSHGNETILLVEDNEMVQKLARAMLESLGYSVITAKNPDHCIELASEYNRSISLLLTDVIMPEMNGKVLFEQLQHIIPELKVIFMSGYTSNVIVHQGVLDENINFIQKPFSLHTLSRKVREILNQ